MRLIWLGLGWLFVGLGVVGAALPLLPTVPFLLLAAICFARASQKAHDWLVGHPTLGPPIRDWRARGAIGRRAKWLATASILASFAIPALAGAPAWAAALQAAALIGVGGFIWTRPEG